MSKIKLNLKQRDIALIVVLLSAVGAGLWYYFLYMPVLENITRLESEIVRLDGEIQRGEAARRNLPELRVAVAEAEAERVAFLAQLPRESEVAQLIDQLRRSAESAGVTLQSIGQGGAQGETVQGVRPLGFNVVTLGRYGETVDFLGSLEALQRFTKIRQVGLSAQGDDTDDPDLNTSYAFTVYVLTAADPGGR